MNVKDYFSFNRGEKRGTLVFLIIIVVLIIANFSVDFFKSAQQTDFSEFENEIIAFEKELSVRKSNAEKGIISIKPFAFNPNTISNKEWAALGFKDWQIKTIGNYKAKGGSWRSKADVSKIYGLTKPHFEQLKPFILLPENIDKYDSPDKKIETESVEYFNFNPNTISQTQWKQLGFKDWQIKVIFNYKNKGGSWETKSDVKKIYGLDESNYNKLEPFILLPDSTTEKKYPKNKNDYTVKININTANAKELIKLKGINSEKYAAIIIKYRKNLGGFVAKEQLKEVWNLSEETFDGFKHQLELGNNTPEQFNINLASTDELKEHPYFDWKIANAIVKYRKANGSFKKVDDIKKIHLISNKIYLKIAPYLTVN